MKFVVCLILLVSSAAKAQEVADCSQVENARERLICFDRLFPSDDRPTPKPATKIDTKPVPDRVKSSEPVSQPVPQQSLPLPNTQRSAPAESNPLSKGKMFDKSPIVNLTTTIKAVRRHEQQKMVFLLENDEVWLQDSPRALPIREGDVVTIKNTRIGGYILRTEGGTTTRVRRIK